MFSLDHFHQTYDTVTTPVTINGRTAKLFTPASIDRFIDPNDLMHNFPLWAKIWEASGIPGQLSHQPAARPDEKHVGNRMRPGDGGYCRCQGRPSRHHERT